MYYDPSYKDLQNRTPTVGSLHVWVPWTLKAQQKPESCNMTVKAREEGTRPSIVPGSTVMASRTQSKLIRTILAYDGRTQSLQRLQEGRNMHVPFEHVPRCDAGFHHQQYCNPLRLRPITKHPVYYFLMDILQ